MAGGGQAEDGVRGRTLLLSALGGAVAGLVLYFAMGTAGLVLGAWTAVVVGVSLVVQRYGGPPREGESPEAYARRRQRLRRARIGLGTVLTITTVVPVAFVALVYYSLNAWADNK